MIQNEYPNKEKRTTILKEYYSRYLKEVRGLSKSSVNHYLDALNNISRRLKNKGLVKEDVYEIMDLNHLAYVREVLYQDPDFIELNERGRRMYSAGLNNYYRFASGEGFQSEKEKIVKLDTPFEPEEPVTIQQTVYMRSNILRTQVLEMADYCCEIDETHQTFIAENTNKPYMEGHHAIPMRFQEQFDHSLDVYANIICLCPLCHRRIHHGLSKDRELMANKIYLTRAERLANSGIELSRDNFLKFAAKL